MSNYINARNNSNVYHKVATMNSFYQQQKEAKQAMYTKIKIGVVLLIAVVLICVVL